MVIALVIAGVAGIGYYYWRQVTFLPDWYSKSSRVNNLPEQPTSIGNIDSNLKSRRAKDEIKLNQEKLERLITNNFAKDDRIKYFLTSTKAIHSDIKDGKLEIGAIVNTENLSQVNLQQKERAIIEQIMQKVPQLQNRDIYVAIQGTPQVKDGKIILDRNSEIKVGKLSFTITEIAKKLNISPEQIQQSLALDAGQFNLQNIELNQGEIKLKTGAQQ